jgi:hypothetical protein
MGKWVEYGVKAYDIAMSRPSQPGQLDPRVRYVIRASCVSNIVSRKSYVCVRFVEQEAQTLVTHVENPLLYLVT